MKRHPLTDLDADIQEHIALETQANIEKGMTPEAARHAALRAFGSLTLARENTRAVWIPGWLDQVRQDIRYGLRQFGRTPVFAAVAVLTLAIGIGLTTAVFSVVNAVLIQPLPYAEADRIVIVRESHGELRGSASPGHFHDWTEQSTVFEAIAAGRPTTFNLADGGDPERVSGIRVTPGYFQVAHMPPALGRYFMADDAKGDGRVVVLSHELWRRRFGGEPSIVGREIRLSGETFVVIGVAPRGYALTDPVRASVVGGFSAQLWTLLVFSPEQRSNYGNHSYGVLGKLKPGVSGGQAQADLERVTRAIAERHPQEMQSRSVDVQPLQAVLIGDADTRLLVLLALVVSVLLIGCVNIASLLLARATTRRKEIAIRASLGGGRPRIVRQLLTESLLLASSGGLAGIVVAEIAIGFFVSRGPASLPRLSDAGLQPEVLFFALASSVLSAALFGTAPAFRAARADLQGVLRETRTVSHHGSQRNRLGSLMVVFEVAVTVVVLVGAGLLFRSAVRVHQVSLGFNSDHVLTARLALPPARYREPEAVTEAYRRLLEHLRTIAGGSSVRAAASTNVPMLSGTSVDSSLTVEGKTFPPGASPSPHIRLVTDQYFEAIGMTVVRGRPLQSSDMRKGAPPVVVVNERLATSLWPGEDPLHKRVSTWTAGPEPEWREVVGVVGDVRTFGKISDVQPEMFLPYAQAPSGSWDVFQRSMVLVLRAVHPETFTAQMRSAVRSVDPSLPLYDVRTMDEVLVGSAAARTFYMRLILLLAATGLGLAALGIYGVIAYYVTQRTSEIGLRLALGAGRRNVVRMVVAHALRLSFAGIVAGLLAAPILTRVMTTFLYEVEATDPQTFLAVAAIFLGTSLLAAWVPAMKAASVDPNAALRFE